MKIHDVNGVAPCVEVQPHSFWMGLLTWARVFVCRLFLSEEEMSIFSVPRSAEWRRLRAEHLKKNPLCAVCGNSRNVVPHHIIPFHVDPSKELDPNNLISLCEGKTFNCHLFFGHYRNWTKHNPDVAEDSKRWNERVKSPSIKYF